MRRSILLVLATSAALTAAACHDSTVAPAGATRSVDPTAGALSSKGGSSESGESFHFVIPAKGGVLRVGDFTLNVPANAVCDPATSGYGEGTWNLPCTPLGRDVKITATVLLVRDHFFAELTPNIRFSPAAGWVTVSARRDEAIDAVGDLRRFAILGSTGKVLDPVAAATAPWTDLAYDDAKTDPTLRTTVNVSTGVISRRVQHFSGWLIASGQMAECSPYVDPGCVPLPGQTDVIRTP